MKHQAVTAPSLIEKRFRELAKQWRADTRYYSSATDIVAHPAYQEIIGMGDGVLHLILREFRDSPAHWSHALKAIAGESPVLPDERSDPKRVREAWLRWGRAKQLID